MVIPIATLIILILGWRKKRRILAKLRLGITMKYEKLKIAMMFLGIAIISVALLGPQRLDGTVKVKHKSLDIYVLLDVSKSMLVEDIVPNRLEREKQIVRNILEKLDGDRIGFIPFSSSAYIQMPLTDDYNMAKMFLDVVDTDMIGGGGSDIGKAIKLAYDSFKRTSSGDKVILIISDGEEHDKASEKVLEKIIDDKLKVYAIGVGTTNGGLIPTYNSSGQIDSYKKDRNGNPVMSKLDDTTLKALTKVRNGTYYRSTVDSSEIKEFLNDISKLEKDGKKSLEINQYKQLFPYFLGVGILIFLLGYFLPIRGHNQ